MNRGFGKQLICFLYCKPGAMISSHRTEKTYKSWLSANINKQNVADRVQSKAGGTGGTVGLVDAGMGSWSASDGVIVNKDGLVVVSTSLGSEHNALCFKSDIYTCPYTVSFSCSCR